MRIERIEPVSYQIKYVQSSQKKYNHRGQRVDSYEPREYIKPVKPTKKRPWHLLIDGVLYKPVCDLLDTGLLDLDFERLEDGRVKVTDIWNPERHYVVGKGYEDTDQFTRI